METTILDVVKRVENSTSSRDFLLYVLIRDAVFEKNIQAIDRIIQRVDGAVPNEKDRDRYANIIGDAIEDVLDYESLELAGEVLPSDPTIIAIAKTLFRISVDPAGKNVQAMKDKAKAMDIIFQRTGGRKSEPTKERHELKYVDPDWMGSLPEGSE